MQIKIVLLATEKQVYRNLFKTFLINASWIDVFFETSNTNMFDVHK